MITIYSFTLFKKQPILQTRRKENTGDDPEEAAGRCIRSDSKPGHRRYTEGGRVMLVEAIIVGIAMAMYVGAEWTAEDVLE